MIWDFFNQFWSLISPVLDYPVEFFQNIGFAVAGALGSFFDVIFHNINDVFIFISWLGNSFKIIFLSLLSPITYIFGLLRFFFGTALSTPSIPESELVYVFNDEILGVFNAIPYWSVVSSILGSLILLLAGIAMLKIILKS